LVAEPDARFTDQLPPEVPLFNEYDALIVQLDKEHCKTKPACAGCPLANWLP
jgi:endonuclease-3 related protein